MCSKGHGRSSSIDISSIRHPHMSEDPIATESPVPRRQSVTKVSYIIKARVISNFYIKGNNNLGNFSKIRFHDFILDKNRCALHIGNLEFGR